MTDISKDPSGLNLNPIDAEVVALHLKGISNNEIAKALDKGVRWVQLKLKQPQIQGAIAFATQGSSEKSLRYIQEKIQTILPEAGDRIAEMMPKALDTLEGVMDGSIAGRAAFTRLQAALSVIKMSGITHSSKLVGEERSIATVGISEESAAAIRSRILGLTAIVETGEDS